MTYSVTCGPWTEPTYLSNATGTIRISGVPAIHNGAVTAATLSLSFNWTSISGPGVIVTGPVTITFGDGGTARSEQGGVGSLTVPVVPGASNPCPSGGPAAPLITGTVVYPF